MPGSARVSASWNRCRTRANVDVSVYALMNLLGHESTSTSQLFKNSTNNPRLGTGLLRGDLAAAFGLDEWTAYRDLAQ